MKNTRTIRLAFAGYGNVTKAMLRLLERKGDELAQLAGVDVSICGISSGSHGVFVDPNGLPVSAFTARLDEPDLLTQLSALPCAGTLEMIAACGADVLIENSPVNYHTGQPAVDHISAALNAGTHVITANKGPIAAAYAELRDLAARNSKRFLFESTVMDGAPIFSLFRAALPGTNLLGFNAILNSTSNLILSLMEDGKSFDQAVQAAQKAGLAETDPSGDVDGWDAAVKVTALARVLMGSDITVEEVKRQGIRGITSEMINDAAELGERYKLICSARLENGKVIGEVAPRRVFADSPFYAIDGASSIIQFETDTLTKLTLTEHDPTPDTTAYGELADLLTILKEEG